MDVREAVWYIAKCALKNEICVLPDDLDWEALLDECNQQTIQMFAFQVVDFRRIPASIAGKWKKNFYTSYYINVKRTEAHAQLSGLLREHGIRFMTLKGVVSASYYRKPELRMIGDVDFYVAEEDFEICHQLLISNEYRFEQGANHHERSYYKDGIHFEMHFTFPGIPAGEEGDALRCAFSDALDRVQTVKDTVVTSDFHHGLIILLHTVYHMMSRGIGLRHLCDWAAFISRYTMEEFSGMYRSLLTESGLWDFSILLSAVCGKYFGIPNAAWDFTALDESVIDSLAEEFFEKGNFGRKKEKDFSEMLLTDDFSIKLGHRSTVWQMIQNTFKITKRHWPLAEKSKIVLLIGSVWFSGKYIVNVLLGRREKFNFVRMSRVAKKRKAQYRKYGLR